MMKPYAVCMTSYRIHEPQVCGCFVSLVLAEDETQAKMKARRMCDERYSYRNGWDQAGDIAVELLEQRMQVGGYILSYSLMTDISEENNNQIPPHAGPSIYATAVGSNYGWGQDVFPACRLSFVTASELIEATRLGAEMKDKLFAMVDGDWMDSYAVAALRLTDVIKVEDHCIHWIITRLCSAP